MIRAMVLGWLFVILALSTNVRAEPKSPTDLTVVVVTAGTLDWPEARRTVEAELAATGFRVSARPSAVATPGKLIDELRASAHSAPDVRGTVSVFREGGEGRAYVWIPERENLFQVDAPSATDPTAAQVLSLRIVELLRVRLLDEPPKPEPPPPEPRGFNAAWVALGPWFSPDLDEPLVEFTVGVGFRVMDQVELDLSGSATARSGQAETEAGAATVSATTLSAHGLWLAHESEHFGLAVGLGGGALLFDGSGLGSGAFVGQNQSTAVGLTSARVRAQWRLRELTFLLLLETGVTLQPITVAADGTEAFRFGQPLLLSSPGVGWYR